MATSLSEVAGVEDEELLTKQPQAFSASRGKWGLCGAFFSVLGLAAMGACVSLRTSGLLDSQVSGSIGLRTEGARGNDGLSGGFAVECALDEGQVPHAYVCAPQASASYPLMVYAHGNSELYDETTDTFRKLASFGFYVSAFQTCPNSGHPLGDCYLGRSSYLEVLKTIRWFNEKPTYSSEIRARVDVALPVTVIGHSTGARVALMVAGVTDSESYCKDCGHGIDDLRIWAAQVGAAVAIDPDEMFKDDINPDVSGFVGAVSNTPVLIFTGSKDKVEQMGSAWIDFQMLAVKKKAFVDLANNDHNAPEHGSAVAYGALWAQAFALGNETAKALVYGDGPTAMRNALDWSKPGERNTGYGKIGLLLCDDQSDSYPSEHVAECSRDARMCGLEDRSVCCGCSVGKVSIGSDGCSSADSQWMECRDIDDIQPGTCAACGRDGQPRCTTHTPQIIGKDGCYNVPPHENIDEVCRACGRDGQRPCSNTMQGVGDDGCSNDPPAEKRNGYCVECGLVGQTCCWDGPGTIGSDGCLSRPQTYYCHPSKRDGTCSRVK